MIEKKVDNNINDNPNDFETGPVEEDQAAQSFLKVLTMCKTVFLQDAAVLQEQLGLAGVVHMFCVVRVVFRVLLLPSSWCSAFFGPYLVLVVRWCWLLCYFFRL